MTNRFYNESFTAALGSLGRSRSVDAQYALIQAAFDLIQSEIDAIQAQGGDITDLGQFPATLTGHALKLLRVNAAASSIEFIAPGNVTIKAIGGTSYTVLAADAGAVLVFTNGSPVTVTVPANVLAAGDVVLARQKGEGRVTFQAGSGLTLNASGGWLATRAQHAQVALVFDTATEATLVGERNAPTLGSYALLEGGNQLTGAQTVAFAALSDAATINTDASLSNSFVVTLAGNRTLANPTNLRDGGIYNWYIKQDGTGSRTLAYGAKFKWAGGTAPVLSTAPGSRDVLVAQYHAADDVLLAVLTKGFS